MLLLAEKLLQGEKVEVMVASTGKRFVIEPGADYGLKHYTTKVDGRVERDRVILSKSTVQTWCAGLLEIPSEPYAVCVSWKTDNMPVPAFLSCHADCYEAWRATTELPIVEVHVTPLTEMAHTATCVSCGLPYRCAE